MKWKAHSIQTEGHVIVQETRDKIGRLLKTFIATVLHRPTSEETARNARLVAAAPEMFDTLVSLVNVFDDKDFQAEINYAATQRLIRGGTQYQGPTFGVYADKARELIKTVNNVEN